MHWMKWSVACPCAVLAAATSQAAIIYTDIPDVTAGQFALVPPLDIDQDGLGDVQPSITFMVGYGMQMGAIGPARVMRDLGTPFPDPMRAYSPGENIGADPGWSTTAVFFHLGDFSPTYGAWLVPGPKFCAVRLEQAGRWHYAWMRVSANAPGGSITIHDFAYESLPDVPIQAGAIPTPCSAVVIAIAGLCAGRRPRLTAPA